MAQPRDTATKWFRGGDDLDVASESVLIIISPSATAADAQPTFAVRAYCDGVRLLGAYQARGQFLDRDGNFHRLLFGSCNRAAQFSILAVDSHVIAHPTGPTMLLVKTKAILVQRHI